ncbi:MAG TPA: methyltransferase domain-containing protein [Myxococcota bacterium]|nr:methyltransferase domain-containing protein [Myxococcota bacterium]
MSDRGREFDAHALSYDDQLAEGLDLTGESKDHFALRRIRWLKARVAALGVRSVDRVLDFGCGDGSSAPLLRDLLGAREVVGVDESPAMLERAAAQHPWARFAPTDTLAAAGRFDLAYCNGVFHHVPPSARAGVAAAVRDALRPGGIFAFWENHPWNPGTRAVMRRVAFDRDAIMLSPPAARRLLRTAGFEVVRTDHLFIFPRALAFLRPLEAPLSRLPIGGQYLVLARRPA